MIRRAILVQDLASIPINCVLVHCHPELQFQGVKCPLLTSVGNVYTHKAHAYMQAKILIPKMNLKRNIKNTNKKTTFHFLFKTFVFIYIYMTVLSAYMYTMCMTTIQGGRKRLSDPLELELQTIVSYFMGDGN